MAARQRIVLIGAKSRRQPSRVVPGTPPFRAWFVVPAVVSWSAPAPAAPTIVAADVVRLEVVAADPTALAWVDMLAFDAFGNLFANREAFGASGGVSYVDVDAGTATTLVSGISRADGIVAHPSGALYVTSEIAGASTGNRVFRIDVSYDGNNVPLSATATGITTSLAIANPEGIVALTESSAFGAVGDLYVAEDLLAGRIIRLELGPGNTATASVLVDTAAGLRRPEGLVFGDFGGALPAPSLYTAETLDNNVLQVGSGGSITVVGDPLPVGMTQPDNVEFGPDGELYVTEDLTPNGRVLRIAADGTHQVVLIGFMAPQGLAFDFDRNDLYIAEQNAARLWRARFAVANGDGDGDADVDLHDAAALQRCFGADVSQPAVAACRAFDFDRDDTVTLADFDHFAMLMTGP